MSDPDDSPHTGRVQFSTPHGLLDLSQQACELLIELLVTAGCLSETQAIKQATSTRPVQLDRVGRAAVARVIASAERTKRTPHDLIAIYHACSTPRDPTREAPGP